MVKIKMLFKNKYIVILIFILLFTLVFLNVLSKKAMPIIMSYASVQTKRIGIEVLRSTGIKEVNDSFKNIDMFDMKFNKNGEIETIDFNTPAINNALIIIAKNVRKRLKEVEEGKNLPEEIYSSTMNKKQKNGIVYEVPFGVMSGNSLLMNMGPNLPVKIRYSGNVGLDVKTKVKQYGLNSALIEVYVYVEVTQRTILPFQSKDIKLTSEVPVVMKIVKGNIPYYLSGTSSSYDLPVN